jgi:hypothetical protein
MKDNFKVSEIPNMSVIYAKDYESMNLAAKKSIDHYNKNRKFIDGAGGECYIEQLMIHLNLMEINERYREQVRNKSTFLSHKEFLMLEQEYMGVTNSNYQFPFKFIVTTPKGYGQYHSLMSSSHDNRNEREIVVNTEQDLVKLFDFDFFGVQHLTYRKWDEILQCICIGYIHKNYGEEWIRKIHNYYKSVYPSFGIDTLSDGEKISFGSIEFEVIFVPGHAPGHVAFYNAENRFLIGGDVVFEGSYGRTDLPGGDTATLKKSILSRVFTLPDETYILSGHGNPTTVGAEKMGNPILMVG